MGESRIESRLSNKLILLPKMAKYYDRTIWHFSSHYYHNITTDSKQLRITHTYEILQCFLKLRVKMSNFLGRTSPWILLHAVN